VAGRYILTPGIFHEIANLPRGVGGEIQLTDGIANLMRRERCSPTVRRLPLRLRQQGRLPGSQCGTGLAHPQLGAGFREYLKTLDI
jgi:UTP--glucose-1-phosphate uridylyltransferase